MLFLVLLYNTVCDFALSLIRLVFVIHFPLVCSFSYLLLQLFGNGEKGFEFLRNLCDLYFTCETFEPPVTNDSLDNSFIKNYNWSTMLHEML